MKKNIIRITESDLHNIIVNTVKRVLKEDVLGNDWNAIDDNENFNVNNNYEVFKNIILVDKERKVLTRHTKNLDMMMQLLGMRKTFK